MSNKNSLAIGYNSGSHIEDVNSPCYITALKPPLDLTNRPKPLYQQILEANK